MFLSSFGLFISFGFSIDSLSSVSLTMLFFLNRSFSFLNFSFSYFLIFSSSSFLNFSFSSFLIFSFSSFLIFSFSSFLNFSFPYFLFFPFSSFNCLFSTSCCVKLFSPLKISSEVKINSCSSQMSS